MTSATKQQDAAICRANDLIETIARIGAVRPLREIAEELTRRRVPTDRGGKWHPTSVARVLGRLGIIPGIELGVGDLLMTRTLPPKSVNAVITSPPYANQRRRQYGGVKEANYPEWTVRWMNEVRHVLADDGNVAIVIRPHVRQGEISDYVLRTRLAIRMAGWHEIEELIWIKPSAAPLGHTGRPRRSWESILWFSNSRHPFCDTGANGSKSSRIGLEKKKGLGDYVRNASNGCRTGVARCRDYVEVSTSSANRDSFNHHPAQYVIRRGKRTPFEG
jgi:site-specific DNA-methyltransferase (adenine-specific)